MDDYFGDFDFSALNLDGFEFPEDQTTSLFPPEFGLNLDPLPSFNIPDFGNGASTPGTGLDSFDPNILNQLAGLTRLIPGGGSGGGGGNSTLSALARMFGIGGDNGLAGLIPLLASIYGGVQNRNSTREATEQMQRSVGEANDTVRGILGGGGEAFKPYTDAGAGAVSQLQGMGPQALAGQYGPIGQRSQLAPGMVSQRSNLAGNFRPIGNGRALSTLRGG